MAEKVEVNISFLLVSKLLLAPPFSLILEDPFHIFQGWKNNGKANLISNWRFALSNLIGFEKVIPQGIAWLFMTIFRTKGQSLTAICFLFPVAFPFSVFFFFGFRFHGTILKTVAEVKRFESNSTSKIISSPWHSTDTAKHFVVPPIYSKYWQCYYGISVRYIHTPFTH